MQKDIAENNLIANNDVFADLINGNRLLGEQIILPDELMGIPTDSSFKDMDGNLRKLTRDVLKEVQKFGVRILFLGIENQTDINNVMPIRDMGYTYTVYMHQIQEIIARNQESGNPAYTKVLHNHQKLKPVLTFVLYFGSKKWVRPLSLLDVLDIPDEQKNVIRHYIPDYRIHVISVRNQPEEIRKRYQSDFGVIADALAYHGRGKNALQNYLRRDKRQLLHAEQTLDLLCALNQNQYIETIKAHYINNMKKKKPEKEGVSMEDIFKDIFEDMEEELQEKYKWQKDEIDKQKSEMDHLQAEVSQQKAEVDLQKAEVNQQKAEVDQQKAEVNQQKAEVNRQKAELDKQKKLIIQNLIAIWDISTISEKTGFAVEDIKRLAGNKLV